MAKLECKDCGWKGSEDDLKLITYPDGSGDDNVCPGCNSKNFSQICEKHPQLKNSGSCPICES